MPVRCLWLLSLVVISCDITSLVVPAGPVPSLVPGAVDTIVARTAAAASTQTAAKVTLVPTGTASATPPPSETPTPTLSPSPTFVFVLPTLTPTKKPTATSESSTAGFGCQLLSQSPPDGSKFAAKDNFKVTWKIKNTGLAKWDAATVDFAYFSGTPGLGTLRLNGRLPADDVINAEFGLVTDFQINSDGVDANDVAFPAAFPYLAAAH